MTVDRSGDLCAQDYVRGLDRLRAAGLEFVASPFGTLPLQDREIELVVDDFRGGLVTGLVSKCSQAFGRPATAGTVTWVSRGTDDDVRGVLERLGLRGQVDREDRPDDELVTVTLTAEELRRVPESRLFTALQSALNCEVRIVVADR